MRAELSPHAYVVGPNSAGKSTIIEAIALAEQCLQRARRKSPQMIFYDRGSRWKGFPLPANREDGEDPIRYDFGTEEARATIHWASGACIRMVWPEEIDGTPPFFYLESKDGLQPRNLEATRDLFIPITIVPIVSPLDRIEELKSEDYVRKHSRSRLASRHFRNHALHMQRTGEWDLFREFSRAWLPEIDLLDVAFDAAADRLAVFYEEPDSRVPKELAWAGDGIQIWVQLLLHLFRASDSETVLLDEPDVYLHPDLQRRLVRLLDGMSTQVILASHSIDVISEAPPEGILWVDRRAERARRTISQQSLSALSESLGGTYDLALARSMRSRLVVATDCSDLKVIRNLARQVGATNLANEYTVSLVQLTNTSTWSHTYQVGSALRELLPVNLPAVVLLQGGLVPQIARDRLRGSFADKKTSVIFWTRAELDNYLLDPGTIARVAGAEVEVVQVRMQEAVDELRLSTRAAWCSAWIIAQPEGDSETLLAEAAHAFDLAWEDSERRIWLTPGSQVIAYLNLWLEGGGYRTVSAISLAKSIRPQALAPEVLRVLLELDETLS